MNYKHTHTARWMWKPHRVHKHIKHRPSINNGWNNKIAKVFNKGYWTFKYNAKQFVGLSARCVARVLIFEFTGEKWIEVRCFCAEAEQKGEEDEVKCLNRCASARAAKCSIMRFLFSSIHCSIAIIEFVHFIYVFVLVFFGFFFSVLCLKRWIFGLAFHSAFFYVDSFVVLSFANSFTSHQHQFDSSHIHTDAGTHCTVPRLHTRKCEKAKTKFGWTVTGKCANHKWKCTYVRKWASEREEKETRCLTWILNVCCVKCSLFVCTHTHTHASQTQSHTIMFYESEA